MIYKINTKTDEVKLKSNNQLVGLCSNGQLLVDLKEDLKNQPIVELNGIDSVEIPFYSTDWYFIPYDKTEEFLESRDIKKEWNQKPEYIDYE